MPTRSRRAFSVLELVLALAIFSTLSMILVVVLRQVSALWVRSNSRDEAVRQLLKARVSLTQDLANSSRKPGWSAQARVGPNLGSNFDGDALTFLSSDSGQRNDSWQVQLSSGEAQPASQITYYLVIPNVPPPDGISPQAGVGQDGYEQNHPAKWLIRRVDPPTGSPPALNSAWTSWLTRPGSLTLNSSSQVVATQLLGFRVRSGPPIWTIELSATRISEARRHIPLGSTPLYENRFTLHQRLSVPAHN